MGCGCRGRGRAGSKTTSGRVVTGYRVTYPEGLNRPPETFLTKLEAERERRLAGGGTITQLTR